MGGVGSAGTGRAGTGGVCICSLLVKSVSRGLRRKRGKREKGGRGKGARQNEYAISVHINKHVINIIAHSTRRTNTSNEQRGYIRNETQTKQEPRENREERKRAPLTNTSWCSNTMEVARSERRTMITRPSGYRSLYMSSLA